MDNVNEAVAALRQHARQSQQLFATRLGMSIATLQNYEKNRTPEPKQLLALQREAQATGRSDLQKVFERELASSLALSQDDAVFVVTDRFEKTATAALLGAIRPRVFLSHSHADAPSVEKTARALIQEIADRLDNADERAEFLRAAAERGLMSKPARSRK
jgi:transcriptional regulator with XRE-family HTH domain